MDYIYVLYRSREKDLDPIFFFNLNTCMKNYKLFWKFRHFFFLGHENKI